MFEIVSSDCQKPGLQEYNLNSLALNSIFDHVKFIWPGNRTNPKQARPNQGGPLKTRYMAYCEDQSMFCGYILVHLWNILWMRRIYISVKLKGRSSHCGIHMQDQPVEYSQ